MEAVEIRKHLQEELSIKDLSYGEFNGESLLDAIDHSFSPMEGGESRVLTLGKGLYDRIRDISLPRGCVFTDTNTLSTYFGEVEIRYSKELQDNKGIISDPDNPSIDKNLIFS